MAESSSVHQPAATSPAMSTARTAAAAPRAMSNLLRSDVLHLAKACLSQDAAAIRCPSIRPPPSSRRSIATTSPSLATIEPGHISTFTTQSSVFSSLKPVDTSPFVPQTVAATLHAFPSLEPLRYEAYPSSHLGLPLRRDLLHRAVIFEGDATRRGTASTKWRDEVHGSARKIRPQKGTGRARLGDAKSPMLRGGGVAFGPKPRDFSTKLPRKIYDRAWRIALSHRFRQGELLLVEGGLDISQPSAGFMTDVLQTHGWGKSGGRSLLVTKGTREHLKEAMGKLGVHGRVLDWTEVDVKDLLELGRVVMEKEALEAILLSHQSDLTNHPAWWSLKKAEIAKAKEARRQGSARDTVTVCA